MRVHVNRDEASCPIVDMQNLWRRGQAARQLDRRLVEKNETGSVVFIGDSMLTVNFRVIEKFVAPNKK